MERAASSLQHEVLLAPSRRRLIGGAIVWVVALAGAVAILVPDLSRLLSLATSTVEVEAVVVAHTDPSARINRRSATRVSYRYEHGGRLHTGGFNTIDEEELRRYRPGAPIRVRVATSDASASRYVGAHGGGLALVLELLLLALAALGPAGYLVVEGRRFLRVRWLLRHGTLAQATVLGRFLGHALDEGQKSTSAVALVRYLFEVDGAEYRGTAIGGTRARMRRMVPHETLAIAYDPKEPSRNCYFGPELP